MLCIKKYLFFKHVRLLFRSSLRRHQFQILTSLIASSKSGCTDGSDVILTLEGIVSVEEETPVSMLKYKDQSTNGFSSTLLTPPRKKCTIL